MTRILLIIFAISGIAGCNKLANVQCEQTSDCNLTGGGRCTAASSGNLWCAYPDPLCASGYRFSTQAVGDGVSGACVDATGIDAGVDAAFMDAPIDGDTACKLRVAFVDGKPPFNGQDDGTGQREVWIANPDGSGQVNLSNNATADDAHPSWSPDGLKVAFASNRSGKYHVLVVNVDGTGLTDLTPSVPASASYPVWSPDGSRIAFSMNLNIWTMNANGSGMSQLTALPAGLVATIVDWSSDSKQLLFEQSPQSGAITFSLYVATIGTGGQPLKLDTGNSNEDAIGWTPFQRIAFSNRSNIFTVNSDGSGIVNVTQNPDVTVSIKTAVVTNKGDTIVFSRDRTDDSRHSELFSISSAGGVALPLTDTTGTRSSDRASNASFDGGVISFLRVTDTLQGTNVVITSQVGTVGLDGKSLHLFNAPNGSNAAEVRLSSAVCR